MSRASARYCNLDEARAPTRRTPRLSVTLAASISLLRVTGLSAGLSLGAVLPATPLTAQHAAQTAPEHPIPDPATVTAEAWQEDLAFLAARIPEQHPNPWHHVSREEFEASVRRLNGRIPELGYPQILVGLMQIVALLGPGDGHSRVRLEPPFIGALYPVRFWWFGDGLYVRSAAPEFVNLVGKRVVWIGGAKVEEAAERLRPVAAADNAFHQRLTIPALMLMPEVMWGVGITEEPSRLNIVVEDALGGQSSAVLTPLPLPEDAHQLPNLGHDPLRLGAPAEWPTMWAPGEETPLYLRDPQNWYWDRYLPEASTHYVQFNVVGDKEDGETVDAFIERVLEAAERNGAQRLVLDIRFNGGGNNFLARPIWHRLVGSDRWNRPGRLFVIIGRRTFSAAQNLATILDEHTQAIFVGEPTGGAPNHYGDARAFRLPNSQLRVSVSTLFWQDGMPWDERPWVPPNLAAELAAEDLHGNRDPALDAILTLEPGAVIPSLMELLQGSYRRGGIDAAVESYRAYKSDPAHRFVNTERIMNEAGYFLLGEGLAAEAIQIFRLNVEAYPESWNVYHSLGEAYMEAGERELAVENYEISLDMNPNNRNARRMLERLREPD
jgi:tetratricopeptide (TPR) repeat protein